MIHIKPVPPARNIGVIDSIVPMFCPQLSPNTPWDWNYTTTPQPGLDGRSIVYRANLS